MTAWTTGKATIKMTGPYGGRVRVGRFIVPRHIFFDLEGNAGHPDAKIHFEWRDGRPQVVELSVTAKGDGRGVRTSDLEAFRLDALASDLFHEHAMIVQEDRADGVTVSAMPDWSDERFQVDWWAVDRHLDDAIASRRGTKSGAELQAVARIYNEHHGNGALLAIASALNVSARTAARRVKDAREAGLLITGIADQ